MDLRCLWGGVCLLAACGRFDGDAVVPTVLHASIAVDKAKPEERAAIDVSLLVHGSDGTNTDAVLARAELWLWRGQDSTQAAPLRLAFPTGFDRHLYGAQCKTVDLVNVGTLNEDLFHWCGEPLALQVWTRPDEPRAYMVTNEPYIVEVRCGEQDTQDAAWFSGNFF